MQRLALCWDGDPIGTVELTEAPGWMTLTPAERAAGVPPSSPDPLMIQGRFEPAERFEDHRDRWEELWNWESDSVGDLNDYFVEMWNDALGHINRHLSLQPCYPLLYLALFSDGHVEIHLKPSALRSPT